MKFKYYSNNLIGSSNQSFSTYFNNTNYGEADILIIDEKLISKNCYESDNSIIETFSKCDGVVISKEISPHNNSFLNEIFENTVQIIDCKNVGLKICKIMIGINT